MFDLHQIKDAPMTQEFKKWVAEHVLGWQHIPNTAQGHGHYYWKDPRGGRYDMLPNFYDEPHWWQVFERSVSEKTACRLDLQSVKVASVSGNPMVAKVTIGEYSLTGAVGPTVCRVALLNALDKKGMLLKPLPIGLTEQAHAFDQPDVPKIPIAAKQPEQVTTEHLPIPVLSSKEQVKKIVDDAVEKMKEAQDVILKPVPVKPGQPLGQKRLGSQAKEGE